MAKRIEALGLSCYYGKNKAVENVTMVIEPKAVTALIGPSGCGKSTFLRCLNRLHEVIPGAHITGQVLLDDQDIYAPGVDPVALRRSVGMVFQRPNPFPTMSIYDNVAAGLKLGGSKGRRPRRRGRARAHRRPLVGRGEGPPEEAGTRTFGWPAAAALYRARHRGRARSAADGRALLGPRPDLDAGDRGPDRRAQGPLHDRHRDAQHAAGEPGLARRPAFFTLAGAGQPGVLVEYDATSRSSPMPADKRTEDYITGRTG